MCGPDVRVEAVLGGTAKVLMTRKLAVSRRKPCFRQWVWEGSASARPRVAAGHVPLTTHVGPRSLIRVAPGRCRGTRRPFPPLTPPASLAVGLRGVKISWRAAPTRIIHHEGHGPSTRLARSGQADTRNVFLGIPAQARGDHKRAGRPRSQGGRSCGRVARGFAPDPDAPTLASRALDKDRAERRLEQPLGSDSVLAPPRGVEPLSLD